MSFAQASLFPRGIGAKVSWVWRYANSPQVEPVCVPAGQNGYVAGVHPVTMVLTSILQQPHFLVCRFKIVVPELPRQDGSTTSMTIINVFIDSP